MTVEEACAFFENIPKHPPQDARRLWMWAWATSRLGQSATTLSGGEAQRVKLALELAKPRHGQDRLYSGRAYHRPACG